MAPARSISSSQNATTTHVAFARRAKTSNSAQSIRPSLHAKKACTLYTNANGALERKIHLHLLPEIDAASNALATIWTGHTGKQARGSKMNANMITTAYRRIQSNIGGAFQARMNRNATAKQIRQVRLHYRSHKHLANHTKNVMLSWLLPIQTMASVPSQDALLHRLIANTHHKPPSSQQNIAAGANAHYRTSVQATAPKKRVWAAVASENRSSI